MDFDPSNAELEVVQRLQSFFNSNTLSDLTVRFSGRELKAHKVILCIHSQWFAKAFRGNFLEASQSTLELHDDNPQAVEGMIRHFYDLDPMSPCEPARPSTPDQTDPSTKLKHIVHLYAVADKYDAPMLRKRILSSFTFLARKNWLTLWNSGELPDIIGAIYAFTVRKDRLRVATIELSLGYIGEFRESDLDAFRELIETVPDFGADILMRVPLPSPVKLPSHLPETLVEVITTHYDQMELHEAAKLGDLAQCKLLIRTGKYVSARDINDSTPLHFAAFYGHTPIVQFLVENARADINARCDNQAFPTPLAWAQYARHHDIVDYLANAGGLET
ncbi:ankyrin repeat-containing domain protein [Clohesyomyces aquaticus]|uniref:Ankyrin repeat-containing domain protein n=1 Tax=Clohesyomyces aquaticus TaxID=1231657 RepID=A0A1Y1ZFL1_9PLEO|nr:ankyrin repeat-containing domain protein [Clohesyomyces aquaticus]